MTAPMNGRADRYVRIKDWKSYRDNFDRIFRKKKTAKNKSEKKAP